LSFSERYGDSVVQGDFSQLEKLVEGLSAKHYVDVGIIGENTETESGLTIAGIGAVHEFGTDKAGRGNSTTIPERSFIRMPLNKKQGEIQKQVEGRLEGHLARGDVKAVFKDIGVAAYGAIQEAFDTRGFGTWKENADSTVQRKGSDAPLIDDGTLRQSISSEVGP